MKKAWERYQNYSEEEKENKATIWLWTLQKSIRKWKNEAGIVYRKKYYKMRNFNRENFISF